MQMGRGIEATCSAPCHIGGCKPVHFPCSSQPPPQKKTQFRVAAVLQLRGGGRLARARRGYLALFCLVVGTWGFFGRHIVLLSCVDFREDEWASLSDLHLLNYSTGKGSVYTLFAANGLALLRSHFGSV